MSLPQPPPAAVGNVGTDVGDPSVFADSLAGKLSGLVSSANCFPNSVYCCKSYDVFEASVHDVFASDFHPTLSGSLPIDKLQASTQAALSLVDSFDGRTLSSLHVYDGRFGDA